MSLLVHFATRVRSFNSRLGVASPPFVGEQIRRVWGVEGVRLLGLVVATNPGPTPKPVLLSHSQSLGPEGGGGH